MAESKLINVTSHCKLIMTGDLVGGWQVYRGMMDAARGVVKNQGVRGLYSGLSVTLVEIVPYAALQFGLYDLFTAAAAKAHADTPVADVSHQHFYQGTVLH